MYNKLFTKILDSSIWLEPTPTRIVWLTFIAVMDEIGFVQFASVANVAHRARVDLDEAAAAIATLEAPDPNSSDPDNEGRRIDRVPGGWMVINADKHRDIATRAAQRDQHNERMKRYRNRLHDEGLREKPSPASRLPRSRRHVTPRDADVTPRDGSYSDTDTDTEERTNTRSSRFALQVTAENRQGDAFDRFWTVYPKHKAKGAALKAWKALKVHNGLADLICDAVVRQKRWPEWTRDNGRFIPHPATWLNAHRWTDQRTQVDAPPDRTPWICRHTPRCPHSTACAIATANHRPEEPAS